MYLYLQAMTMIVIVTLCKFKSDLKYSYEILHEA